MNEDQEVDNRQSLVDSHGRAITYMRISVTDRCNMRCTYCMPEKGVKVMPHPDILTYEEILRVVRISSSLGVNKFRITGGEPLVRNRVIGLIREIASIDGVEITFTTNGLLLEKMGRDLRNAGVKRLNISIDSMDRERFRDITRNGDLDKVIRGIEVAHEVGFDPIKLNVVVMKGVNDDEIVDFVNLAKEKPYNVRFIEFMPMKENSWSQRKFIPSEKIEEMVRQDFSLTPDPDDKKGSPSKNYIIEGYAGKVGFISPVSRHFCDSCNRIRLTSDGHIRSCLLREGEIDIKNPMRMGEDDEYIRSLIESAVMMKPAGHLLDKNYPEGSGLDKTMTQIGG